MAERKVGIISECVCDLPRSMLKKYDIDTIYFIIETDTGVFTDTDEVTADNILDYMDAGGEKSRSGPPDSDVYKKIFEKNLKKYDEVILVAISSKISNSCETAGKAVKDMGKNGEKVHIFDSGHLSTGLGFLVLKAGELASAGAEAAKIIDELSEMRSRICTSFMAKNADYLYRNGFVSLAVKRICSIFRIHPVLKIKNGKLTLQNIEIGDYETSAKHYIRKAVGNKRSAENDRCFVTHVGCSVKMIDMIKKQAADSFGFKEIFVTKASATISSNCGRETFGILYVKNK